MESKTKEVESEARRKEDVSVGRTKGIDMALDYVFGPDYPDWAKEFRGRTRYILEETISGVHGDQQLIRAKIIRNIARNYYWSGV